MSYNFFKENLSKETNCLPFPQATLLSIYNCEKIVDLYKLFENTYLHGNYSLIRKMTNYIWKNIYECTFDKEIDYHFNNLEKLVPDSEKYPGFTNAIVLNIIICLDVAYKCLMRISNDSNLTGIYVYDTIKQILLDKDKTIKYITKDVVERIDHTSVVLTEINDEILIINQIKNITIDQSIINKIHNESLQKRYTYTNIEW
jgi:uncharacterized protein YjaG (DUF416 family)